MVHENNERENESMGNHYQDHGYLIKAGGIFAGLFVGGLIGAGAMLLWAPQSGKKTRAQIQNKGVQLRDRLTDTVDDTVAQARDEVHRGVASVRKQTRQLQQRGQDMFDGQMEVVSQVVEAEKTAVHNIAGN
jgi:gas vesicle protein